MDDLARGMMCLSVAEILQCRTGEVLDSDARAFLTETSEFFQKATGSRGFSLKQGPPSQAALQGFVIHNLLLGLAHQYRLPLEDLWRRVELAIATIKARLEGEELDDVSLGDTVEFCEHLGVYLVSSQIDSGCNGFGGSEDCEEDD